MWGFNTLKDVLEVVIVPVLLVILAWWFPHRLDLQRRSAFMDLIRRELSEMTPEPLEVVGTNKWPDHLRKRFIHEEIFRKPSENRDFILSLHPDLAYHETQLWMHYDKAAQTTDDAGLVEHGRRWCDYLRNICQLLDGKPCGRLHDQIYKPWKLLIDAYHKDDRV